MSDFDRWKFKDEILDAMAEVLAKDPSVPADKQKKFQTYVDIKKAESRACQLMEEMENEGSEDMKDKKAVPKPASDTEMDDEEMDD